MRSRLSAIISFALSPSLSYANQSSANKTAGAFVISAAGGVQNIPSAGIKPINRHNSSFSPKTIMNMTVDPAYPGTAVERMMAVRSRVAALTSDDLNGNWENVRRRILWAGGLKDLPTSIPGQGYTGHSFNDSNHVDLTCMLDKENDNLNDGSVKQIAVGNLLGPGIRIATLPELGPGGSWSTCANGCDQEPPQDVAHVQFRSRIAFKLVWVPNPAFDRFALLDDDGEELARGRASEGLPSLYQRQLNYSIVKGSKYSKVVDAIAQEYVSSSSI